MQEWAIGKIAERAASGTSFKYRGVFLRSCTGSGKTIAYLLPILQQLADAKADSVQMVIMANMAESAKAIHQVICYLTDSPTTSYMAVGGLYKCDDDLEAIVHTRPKILVGTGGRLCDIIEKDSSLLAKAEILVLDEGQLMLLNQKGGKMHKSWYEQSATIWKAMRPSPYKQLVSASATASKDAIDQIAGFVKCSRSEVTSLPETADSLQIQLQSRRQYRIIFPDFDAKLQGLAALFLDADNDFGRFLEPTESYRLRNKLESLADAERLREKFIIFCNRIETLGSLQRCLSALTPFITDPEHRKELNAHSAYCFPHHAKMDYATCREPIYSAFERGATAGIMSAGSLSLAIDVRNIGAIVNFETPYSIDRMVHQCGRTGRGYASDIDATPVVNLVTKGVENDKLEAYAKQLGIKLEDVDPPTPLPTPPPRRHEPRNKSKSPLRKSSSSSSSSSSSKKSRKDRSRSRSRGRSPEKRKSKKHRARNANEALVASKSKVLL